MSRLYQGDILTSNEFLAEFADMPKEPIRDHIDSFLEAIRPVLPDLDYDVEGIVDRISGLSRRLQRMMDETLSAFGLDSGDYKVIGALSQAGPPFRSTPGRLARRMELSSGTMTSRLDRLEAAGMVRRLPDPDDRRSVLVELTEHGSETYQSTVGVQAEKEALVTSALSPREKAQLNSLLRKMMVEFERREGRADHCD
jgi:DNA-binding MarR family transcriptional regulator